MLILQSPRPIRGRKVIDYRDEHDFPTKIKKMIRVMWLLAKLPMWTEKWAKLASVFTYHNGYSFEIHVQSALFKVSIGSFNRLSLRSLSIWLLQIQLWKRKLQGTFQVYPPNWHCLTWENDLSNTHKLKECNFYFLDINSKIKADRWERAMSETIMPALFTAGDQG